MFGSNGWAMAVTPKIRYFSRRCMSRPLILLSNDDGYQSVGLQRLYAALCEMADVVVCAPEFEQSAASHALSLHRPLRLKVHDASVYSVDGTPADSVYVALFSGTRILPRAPNLVVSGLNHGVNLGDDVFYSGTVAAAREGALRGYRAMALSVADDASLDAAAELSVRLARRILERAGSEPLLCNIKLPARFPMARGRDPARTASLQRRSRVSAGPARSRVPVAWGSAGDTTRRSERHRHGSLRRWRGRRHAAFPVTLVSE